MKQILSIVMLILFVAALATAAFADGTPTVRVSQESAAPGEEVTVTVSLENNPGIMAFVLGIDYDTEALELVASDHTGLGGSWIIGDNAVWVGSGDSAYEGDFLLLTFRVKESANGEAEVTLRCGEGAFANSSEQSVDFSVVSGGVTVGGGTESGGSAATEKPSETAKPSATTKPAGTVATEDGEDTELVESLRDTMLEMTGGEELPSLVVSTEAPAAEKTAEGEETAETPEIEHSAVTLREAENEKSVDVMLIAIIALGVLLVALVVLIILVKKRG